MRIEGSYIDFFQGPHYLKKGYENLKEKAVRVNYEKLVTDSTTTLNKIFRYLELDFDESIIQCFHKINFEGRMGDHTGTNQYNQIDNRPLEKWKNVFNTRFRKKFAMRYLSNIGTSTMATFGYNFNDIIQEVKQIKNQRRGEIKDRYDLFLSFLFRMFEIPLFKKKIKDWFATKRPFIIHI